MLDQRVQFIGHFKDQGRIELLRGECSCSRDCRLTQPISDHRTRNALIDAMTAKVFCGAPSVFFPECTTKLSAIQRTENVCYWVFLPITILCTTINVVANTFSPKWEERMHEIEKMVAKETITGMTPESGRRQRRSTRFTNVEWWTLRKYTETSASAEVGRSRITVASNCI